MVAEISTVFFDLEKIREIKSHLCVNRIGGGETFWTLGAVEQRNALVFTYGDFRFVRAPFKGVCNPEQWFDYARRIGIQPWQSLWVDVINLIQNIDSDGDKNITVPELDAKVYADGIFPGAYAEQISTRDRCRASALMSFLLRYDADPFPIEKVPEWSIEHRGIDHPLFKFEECEQSVHL